MAFRCTATGCNVGWGVVFEGRLAAGESEVAIDKATNRALIVGLGAVLRPQVWK
jgi:hypothetical protein